MKEHDRTCTSKAVPETIQQKIGRNFSTIGRQEIMQLAGLITSLPLYTEIRSQVDGFLPTMIGTDTPR